MAMHFIQICNRRRKRNDHFLFLLLLLPAFYLLFSYVFDKSQINIFEAIMTLSGHWSLVFYICSYAISPFQRFIIVFATKQQWSIGKRLTDWNFLLTHRRTFGIASFHLCAWHFLCYFYLELDFIWAELLYDLSHRNSLTAGMAGFVVMALLFGTSFHWAKKNLGYRWRYIHNTTHIIVLAAILHIVWIAKDLQTYHYMYIVTLLLLLIERLYRFFSGRNHRSYERQRRRRKNQ